MPNAIALALDLLDPPPDPNAWLCDREECDGEPHDGFTVKHARTKQRPPAGDWLVWLILAGRGWGKTRTGAEWAADQMQPDTRGAIVAPTYADARDTCVEGESGLLAVLRRRGVQPLWNRSLGELIHPNGARAKLFSADEPERLRGPQHHWAWPDELAAWRYPEAWDQLQFGLRLGRHPRSVVTTTPRPIPLIAGTRDNPDLGLVNRDTTVVVRGHTYENRANLAPAALDELERRYAGTRLGRQELAAEILEDVEGALWTRAMIEDHRADCPSLDRVVVAIDPAATAGSDSDDTGIVVAGRAGEDYYVLDDLTCHLSPDGWGRKAVGAYRDHAADRIVGEANNGGDMVEHVIRTVDAKVAYRKVTATRGKKLRAEPIAALYEQGRVHHVGSLADLEDQMCSWTPDDPGSPDRLDALVWALTELSGRKSTPLVGPPSGLTGPSKHRI